MEAGRADRVGPIPRRASGSRAIEDEVSAIGTGSSEVFERRFEARSELIEGYVRRIAICGELDRATAPRLQETLRPDVDGGLLVVDLSECDFIDLTGLALLVGTWRRLAGHDPRFALCGLKGQVERILNITGVVDTIPVFQTLDEALASNPWRQSEMPPEGSSTTSPIPLFRRPQRTEIFDRGSESSNTPWRRPSREPSMAEELR